MPAQSPPFAAATSPRSGRDTGRVWGLLRVPGRPWDSEACYNGACGPELRCGCVAMGVRGRRWGHGPGPQRRWKPWLGTALRLVEEHLWPLGVGRGPPRHVQLYSPGHQAFLCNETAGGQGGQGQGRKAGSPSCYLFSMFCICKLREVKLASRSVTSSTCRTKVRLCHRPRCLSPWVSFPIPKPGGQPLSLF